MRRLIESMLLRQHTARRAGDPEEASRLVSLLLAMIAEGDRPVG